MSACDCWDACYDQNRISTTPFSAQYVLLLRMPGLQWQGSICSWVIINSMSHKQDNENEGGVRRLKQTHPPTSLTLAPLGQEVGSSRAHCMLRQHGHRSIVDRWNLANADDSVPATSMKQRKPRAACPYAAFRHNDMSTSGHQCAY